MPYQKKSRKKKSASESKSFTNSIKLVRVGSLVVMAEPGSSNDEIRQAISAFKERVESSPNVDSSIDNGIGRKSMWRFG